MRFIMKWFTWIMVILAVVVAYFSQEPLVPALLSWLLFFLAGIVGLWAAMGHLLEPQKTAKSIGWTSSPFQREMGFANLAIGVAGIMAPWQEMPFKLCLIIIFSILWWGCAYGHIKEMVNKKNHAVFNVGPMIYTTILAPPVLWILYWMLIK